jgi:RNA-splicing ligase RtcB
MVTDQYEVMNVEDGRHVKMWTRGVPIEDAAKKQLANTARMPFVFRHLAAMPDVHLGIGATVGSVVATKGAIIPAAVGDVLVTRKGALRAGRGELGIIPGSMGARSYIVRGRGNPESFASCSHGAGRRMSRTEARKRCTVAEHEAATAGVECRKDEAVIDETPAAYKDIEAVMAAQRDLVEIVHTLKQIVCVKG